MPPIGRRRPAAACVLAAALALLLLPLRCSAQTAYIMPSLEEDNPSNHSYRRLGSIISNRVLLQDYDRILLLTDYRVIPTLFGQEDPVRLSRNLTIASANFSTQGYRLLELDFAQQRLLIPEGLSLTLKDLALGRARKTSGQGIPFFVGEGERSQLVLDNVVRIRTACAHNEPELLAALSSIARRHEAGQQQVQLVNDFQFRGKVFEESIRALDLKYFVGPVDVPDTTYFAGYSMRQVNSTRVCETYVSDECVAKKGAEVCVDEQIDILTAPRLTEQQQQQPSGSNLAAIVAPSVIGGLLLAGAAAALVLALLRRSHSRRSGTPSPPLLPLTDKRDPFSTGGTAKSGSSGGGGDASPRAPGDAVVQRASLPGFFSGADGSIEHLAIGNRAGNWQLGAFHTAPEFADATPHDKLRLGVLLGAGSFGRVYRGWWRNTDVAVKVLQHDGTTAAAISNEVDLVMSFRHENIVRAYYFVTWTRSTADRPDTHSLPADQFSGSFDAAGAGAAAAAVSSPLRSQPGMLSPGALPKGLQLTPVAECSGARSSTAGQSTSAPASAAASASSLAGPLSSGSTVVLSGSQSSRTFRVSIAGLAALEPKPADAPAGSRGSGPLHGTSSSHSSSNHAGNSAAGSSSHSSSSNAGPRVPLPAQAGSKAPAAHASIDSAAVHAKLQQAQRLEQQQQQQQQQHIQVGMIPTFVPTLRTATDSSSKSAAGRSQLASSAGVPSAAVQLVPFTRAGSLTAPAADVGPSSHGSSQQQHGEQPQQQQRRLSLSGADGAAYDVSAHHSSSRSNCGWRDVTVGSGSTAAGTSLSLIPAYSGQHRQQQQPKSSSHQQEQLQEKQLAPLRYMPVPVQRSPSPAVVEQSSSLSVPSQSQGQPQSQSQSQSQSQPLSQPLWLLTNTASSSSAGPSGSRSAPKARTADEAQTWLILEYCDGTTLLDALAPEGPLGPHVTGHRRLAQVLTLLLDVAAGMSYLHSRNVLHGDLKPGNVLIKLVQGAPYGRVAKVADFGLSRALNAGQSHRSTRTFGTLNHAPPELLRLGRLSPAADLYAFGILAWECFTGKLAFEGLHYGEVFEQVALLQCRPTIPPEMPTDYAELVTQCWAADPLMRPAFTTVMQRLEGMLATLVQDQAEAHERADVQPLHSAVKEEIYLQTRD